MQKLTIRMKRKLLFLMVAVELILVCLIGRVFYIQAVEGGTLQERAYAQQTRDRLLTPVRGSIFDRNMTGMAVTETVYSISVIHNQVKNQEEVAKALSDILQMDYNSVLKDVSRKVALERIQAKVGKEAADAVRKLNLPGVAVDEDVRRVYPYSSLASQVIGFVGRDNQGIIGLEAKYDKYLKGESGKILTETDVKGRELPNGVQTRIKPEPGLSLVTSIDVILQQYAEQAIEKAVEVKNAKRGLIILMDPQNGEIYAMAGKPDFDLNDPFTINDADMAAVWDAMPQEERMAALNQMWRNFALNDTYEPGSTFKLVTSAAGLEEKAVSLYSPFNCSGSVTVGGRQIKCWRYPLAHGSETFLEGVKNSCNPVFMEIGARLGPDKFYEYLQKFGFGEKTGVDLPGEAVGIMYKPEKIGPVELATMSFGQSLTITPLQLMRAAAATVNGGCLVTPHVGMKLIDGDGNIAEEFKYGKGRQVVSEETSKTMRFILESVVNSGTGNRTYIPGCRVGGKTATSEKLPRRSGKYISSFLAFAPAEDPRLMALVIIDEPQGAYYGGAVAGPIMKEILENALPYLNVEPEYSEAEQKLPEAARIAVPDLKGMKPEEAQAALTKLGLKCELSGKGGEVTDQFPLPGEILNGGAKVILTLGYTP